MTDPLFVPLLSSEIGGSIAVNVFAIVSTFALFTVACRIIWLAIGRKISPDHCKPQEYVFFNTQLGYYAICLLLANLFTDISGLIGLRWSIDKGVTEGQLCTLQELQIFIASVVSAILYSLIFLVLRGTLNIKGGIKLTLDPYERKAAGASENYHRFVARIARSMLWYPIAYVILLIPYSVMRLLDISGFKVTFASMIFAYACWFMLGVVNVLLLYNTFRVLGPAFDAPSQRSSSASSFASGRPLNDDEEKQRAFEEKVDRYRYPTPSYRSPQKEAFGGQVTSSPSSVRPLLPVHQDRAASVKSFYSYPSSPSIGRAITPVDELERTISPPEPARQKFSPSVSRALSGDHVRQASTESLGLPAAPRRTRSPVLHQPSLERMHSPSGSLHGTRVERRLPHKPSTQTFGRRESGGSPSSSPSSNYNSPLLSAMNSGFAPAPGIPGSPGASLPRHSRSFSAAIPALAPAPTSRQRTVLARHGSVGNTSEFGNR
ncbi:hypothetical protein H0H81_000778 [Sphagnurus paluster]|uniref:Uncharacterized protein n=1 Tax=Sphagnurus paluster TaxID=117069 RepID=A0A9P7GNN5_9AGAR|nr:hypothetical protein H0H81_000778 [Sphagnurus paluster]